MTAFNTRRNLLALLLAVVLMCALFTVGVAAEEETGSTTAETTVATEATDASEGESSSEPESSSEDGSESGSETASGTETTSGEETTTGETTTKEEESTAEPNWWEQNFMRNDKPFISKIVVWVLVIGGLIAGGVFCIVKREKVKEFLRALNSERKRIVWSSWKDTRKNTFVVLAVVVGITLVIFLFNFALEMILGGSEFSFGTSLLDLIVGLFK